MIIDEHKTIFIHIPKNAGTSIEEYFANGFEKYFTESPEYVKSISPVLYQKVVAALNAK